MFEQAWRLGTFANIPVKVHWTFFLILAFFGYDAWSQGTGLEGIVIELCFVLTLFLCVLLHEFGHALTAKKYGIVTEDIILLPIGGVARLRNLPEKPVQELVIAVMGPAVNVVIAILIVVYFIATYGLSYFSIQLIEELNSISWSGFLPKLLISNVALVVFNMIPAFPMDGGRVLRAFLAMGFGKLKATRIASIIAQIICTIWIIAAIYFGLYLLAVIGGFIFMSATQEYRSVALDAAIRNKTINDCYRKEYHSFTEYTTVKEAYEFILHRRDRTFPVINLMGQFSGSVSSKQIQLAFKKNQELKISEIFNNTLLSLHSSTALYNAMYAIKSQSELILVTELDEVIGVVDMDAIQHLIELQS